MALVASLQILELDLSNFKKILYRITLNTTTTYLFMMHPLLSSHQQSSVLLCSLLAGPPHHLYGMYKTSTKCNFACIINLFRYICDVLTKSFRW